MLGEVAVSRAKELLDILRHAAELKKEKCYVTTENVDGKPVKELRYVTIFKKQKWLDLQAIILYTVDFLFAESHISAKSLFRHLRKPVR